MSESLFTSAISSLAISVRLNYFLNAKGCELIGFFSCCFVFFFLSGKAARGFSDKPIFTEETSATYSCYLAFRFSCINCNSFTIVA